MDYISAKRLAHKIQGELSPWCQRIETAGSIRRKRPECGDIDLVLLPHPGPEPRQAILDRVKRHCTVKSGESIESVNTISTLPNGFQVDLFFARAPSSDLFAPIPGNFGSLLLCRTGSMRHNIQLAQRAKDLGMHYDPYRGLLDSRNTIVASETEESIYEALGLEWRPPEHREQL